MIVHPTISPDRPPSPPAAVAPRARRPSGTVTIAAARGSSCRVAACRIDREVTAGAGRRPAGVVAVACSTPAGVASTAEVAHLRPRQVRPPRRRAARSTGRRAGPSGRRPARRSSSSVAPARSGVRRSKPGGGEQAGVQLAGRGEAGPHAVAAERAGHRGDEAELAARRRRSASARRPASRAARRPARAGGRRRPSPAPRPTARRARTASRWWCRRPCTR